MGVSDSQTSLNASTEITLQACIAKYVFVFKCEMSSSQNYGKMTLTRASVNKEKAGLIEIPIAVCLFTEKNKQNHLKLSKFQHSLGLFRIGETAQQE